ncbi:MAG: ABC transporter substrate-binding protein [Alphaproteobacteria bacterium]|jgi:peptide/nickel transport system substrate-binding protein|nr:ABC transporter substrate-binding protein [Alphaproteobacteria bacterium]
MKISRIIIAAAVALAFGLQPAFAADPKKGGTLKVIGTANPRHFNAAVQSGVATMEPGAQLFATLLRIDGKFRPHPYLATEWRASDDGLSMTLKLVKGAKFHDGHEITSEDVAFSLKANRDNHPFKAMFAPLAEVETPDPHTVILKLKQPHPAIMLALTAPLSAIIPKHVYGDGQNIKKHPRNTKDVVGSGPFILKEFKRREHIILERNPNFFQAPAYLDKIVYQNFGQTASQIIALEQGKADLIGWTSGTRTLARLKKSKHLAFNTEHYVAIGPNNWLAFNLLREPLKDLRVRKAIAYAVDRNFITKALHAGFSWDSTGPIVPGTPYYSGDVERYDLDLDKANALLDEAGHKRGANGVRFALKVDYIPAARIDDHAKAVAEYLKPQLKKIGIDVQVRVSPDFPTWANYVRNWDFDMTMDLPFNWGDPVIGVHRSYLSTNIKKGVIWSNTQSYANAKVDELLGMAGRELDPAKRKGLYQQFQKIVVDELPVYWINVVPYHTVYNKKTVSGVPDTVWGMAHPMDKVYKLN